MSKMLIVTYFAPTMLEHVLLVIHANNVKSKELL